MSSLTDELTEELDRHLCESDRRMDLRYPDEPPGWQPVHTVYVPADAYARDLRAEWGERALSMLDTHGQDRAALAALLDVDIAHVDALIPGVRHKLSTDPIEDLRIDFEDGFGHRADNEEDAAVDRAAAELLASSEATDSTSASYGIRFKSLERDTRERGIRTLTRWAERIGRAQAQSQPVLVTLPKVSTVEQVEAMAHACQVIERRCGMRTGRMRFEIQVETPQSIVGPDGTALVARMIHAAGGRCTALHFGTYDYSAACGIAAQYQAMDHPAADHAKAVMQAAAAGTGVMLSDGSTNLIPAGPTDQVLHAWGQQARLIRRSLERGFYQGWDLHPAQLPARFLATHAFYRRGFPEASERLSMILRRMPGSKHLEEPASARALASFVLRGRDCGALAENEILTRVGADPADLEALAGRRPSQ